MTVLDGVGSANPRYGVPGAVVLSTSLAKELGLQEGEVIPVTFADGQTEQLRVASVLPNDPARGDFVMARDLVRRHDGSALTENIFIPQEQAPATVATGAALHDAETYATQKYNKENQLMRRFSQVLILIAVGYTRIAIANTMAMAAQSRKNDFAVLKSAGGTVRQLLRLATGEAALVVSIGTALGLLVTLPPLTGMAAGLAESTATPVTLQIDGPIVVLVILGCPGACSRRERADHLAVGAPPYRLSGQLTGPGGMRARGRRDPLGETLRRRLSDESTFLPGRCRLAPSPARPAGALVK